MCPRPCVVVLAVAALAGCDDESPRPIDRGLAEAAPDRTTGSERPTGLDRGPASEKSRERGVGDQKATPDQLAPFTATYYVDSAAGLDSNGGTTPATAWKSLAKVQAQTLKPGTAVFLKRGSSWTGGLIIKDSGAAGSPIVLSVYGSGARPVIRNPGGAGSYTKCVQVKGSHVIVEGLLLEDAHESGVHLAAGTSHDIVRDIEATKVGFGVNIEGQQHLVTGSYFHDLHMVVNTQGGDDDYGAVGVVLSSATGCEVSYNKMVNCIAPSSDYGTDGGVVEWWAASSGNKVHHNWGQSSNGFLEVGGQSHTVKDNLITYNVSINNNAFLTLHVGGTFGVNLQNFRVENNTIVELANPTPGWALVWFAAAPSSATSCILRNNIISLAGFSLVSNQAGFTHENNLYHLVTPAKTKLGFSPGSGEKQADPLLVDPAKPDLHLKPGSPAINAGKDMGHPLDFDGHTVPCETAPEIGAYEAGC